MPEIKMTTSIALPAASKSNYLSFVALLLGAAALALGGVFLRHSELPPTASAVYRVALAIPIFFLLDRLAARAEPVGTSIRATDKVPAIPVKLILVGFIFSGNLALYHWSMTLTTLANSNLLANLAPIFVVLGSRLFLGKKFNSGFMFGMLFALAGAFVLIGHRLDFGSNYMTGNLLGLLTAVFYGSYLLAVSLVRSNYRTMTVMAWSSVGTLIVLLPITLLRGESLVPHTVHGMLMLLALAVVSHVGGQGLIAYALAKLPAALSSITLLVQPVIATVLGACLFHEYLSATEFVGGAVILIGIVTARRFS
ncbi:MULTISPECIES: DMT family transporter [unclassified Variovorax]|uniref:DMT family transporter n=1 Tax=unclassified Variovorax TaxID=663243 RepID=UPI0008D03CF8|nr:MULTISPECIES: DMT family transporter [unclassified Variovorax]SEK08220.1 EamA-like transporter family protein [Variovorax sp. OK202]SFD54983.1 EamA-like transporter family protein [Variovorax sp. OK212]